MPTRYPEPSERGGFDPYVNTADGGAGAFRKGAVTDTSEIGWRPFGASRFSTGYYRGSSVNWADRAGVLWENPAVALALAFLFEKVAEPTFELARKGTDGKFAPVEPGEADASPLLALLETPNPEYSGDALFCAAALSYKLAGEAYIIKARRGGRRGLPAELWYEPHWRFGPVAPADGGPTEVYERILPDGKKERFAREDVIHFKNAVDPSNPRHGFDVFRALLRNVVSDNEVDAFTASILGNMGVSTGMLSGADAEHPIPDTQRDILRDELNERTTGDKRGSWIVSSLPVNVETIGRTPAEMELGTIGERPEARILAGFGFNAMALGLPSDDKKYANLKESRESALENGIIPMLATFDQTLTAELLPDLEMNPAGLMLRHNYDNVKDLAPDADKVSARHLAEWLQGARRLSEVRAALKLPEDLGEGTKDGYYWQLAPEAAAKVKPAPAPGSGAPATGTATNGASRNGITVTV